MNKKPTLLVLAAGIGSRYGGLKQVDGMGPNDQAIIDYSVYDAKRAGFGKVVFIIRKEIEKDFRNLVGKRIEKNIETVYTFQEMDTALGWFDKKLARKKPLGTGHAMLAAKDALDGPFAVINADDFYGPAAFSTVGSFLEKDCTEKTYSMVSYRIQNTLSDHGHVSRGVCSVDAKNNLTDVTERTKIERKGNGIFYIDSDNKNHRILKNTPVSMNFWGFHPNILETTEKMFRDFIQANYTNEKAEFYIPLVANTLVQNKSIQLKVLDCDSQWFGVTYPDDKAIVQKALADFTEQGLYPANLWA